MYTGLTDETPDSSGTALLFSIRQISYANTTIDYETCQEWMLNPLEQTELLWNFNIKTWQEMETCGGFPLFGGPSPSSVPRSLSAGNCTVRVETTPC